MYGSIAEGKSGKTENLLLSYHGYAPKAFSFSYKQKPNCFSLAEQLKLTPHKTTSFHFHCGLLGVMFKMKCCTWTPNTDLMANTPSRHLGTYSSILSKLTNPTPPLRITLAFDFVRSYPFCLFSLPDLARKTLFWAKARSYAPPT